MSLPLSDRPCYIIVIEDGDYDPRLDATGCHVALYPAAVLLDPPDELPPPLWEALVPPAR